MSERVKLEIIEQVAYVTLNRPDKYNAMDLPMFKAIISTQNQLRKMRDIRAVVISGEGKHFCTGLDVKALLQQPKHAFGLLFKWLPWLSNDAQKVCTGWRELAVPVFALLHGKCWGGGLQLALGADFRVASPDTELSVMEGKWGLIPDMGGNLALRELMKQDRALWLAMSAESISAQQSKEWGLVTEVCDDPQAWIDSRLELLRQRSPDAIAGVKQMYRNHWAASNGKMLATETWTQIKVLMTRNQRIAVAKQGGKEQAKAQEFEPRRFW